MTKVFFILSSICSGLEFWSVNHASICKNSELMIFYKITILGKISSNCQNNLLEINIHKTLELCY